MLNGLPKSDGLQHATFEIFDKLEANLYRVDPDANYFTKKIILPLPSLPKDSIDDFLNGLLPDTRLIFEP